MSACLECGKLDYEWGVHHNVHCSKYKTEKHSYLFYYEEAESAWIPAPTLMDSLIIVEDQLEEGEKMEIEFKRVDLTDFEVANLPVE